MIQKTPKAAMEPVMPIAINHQSGVLLSGTPAIRSVIHAIERLFSTSGGRGMRSTKGTILGAETFVSAIMRFLQSVRSFAFLAALSRLIPLAHARRRVQR